VALTEHPTQWRGQAMAKATLQEQAIDRTKPFTVGYWIEGRYHEKTTYPLKQSVEYRKRLELPSPWDSEVR
jgi:hypothetical protein